MTYSRLLSAGAGATAHELLAEVRPRERAPADRPFVFVNFVSTLDGRAASRGATGELGAEADLEMLLELRVLADARADRHRHAARRGLRAADRRARSAGPPRGGRASPRPAGGADLPRARPPVGRGAVRRARAAGARLHRRGRRGAPRRRRAGRGRRASPEPSPAAVARRPPRAAASRALPCEGGPAPVRLAARRRARRRAVPHARPVLTGEDDAPRIARGRRPPGARPRDARSGCCAPADELFLRYAL